VGLKDILLAGRYKEPEAEAAGLTADFKELAAVKRYAPSLKEFQFRQNTLQAGDARSAFKGRGIELEEVRAYAYGDDLRDIDWRVTARKNQPFTKLYAEEKDREVYVWLDLSAAMRFGTRHELKSVTAAKTAALLGWFTLENKDRFGVAIFDGRKTLIFQPNRTYDHLLAILKKVAQISQDTLHETVDSDTAEHSLQLLQKRISRRAIVFILTTFDDFGPKYQQVVSAISRFNELYLVNIYDALEGIAPPAGEYPVRYGNERQLLHSGGREFAEKYNLYFAKKRELVRHFCAKFNCRYREIRTDIPIHKQLRPV